MILESVVSLLSALFQYTVKFTQLLALNAPGKYSKWSTAIGHCACANSKPSSAEGSARHVFPGANAEPSAKARYTWTSSGE